MNNSAPKNRSDLGFLIVAAIGFIIMFFPTLRIEWTGLTINESVYQYVPWFSPLAFGYGQFLPMVSFTVSFVAIVLFVIHQFVGNHSSKSMKVIISILLMISSIIGFVNLSIFEQWNFVSLMPLLIIGFCGIGFLITALVKKTVKSDL